tara:strand:+ start:114 stop:494 length:381 start_codon:yes stop_codon:yes gene_type:complete
MKFKKWKESSSSECASIFRRDESEFRELILSFENPDSIWSINCLVNEIDYAFGLDSHWLEYARGHMEGNSIVSFDVCCNVLRRKEKIIIESTIPEESSKRKVRGFLMSQGYNANADGKTYTLDRYR